MRLGAILLAVPSLVGMEHIPAIKSMPPDPPSMEEIVDMVIHAAREARLPVPEVLDLVRRESDFDPTVVHENKNHTYDSGLFQLNDVVVESLGIEDPMDLATNLRVGIQLLKKYYADSGKDWEETLCLYAHPYSCSTY